MRSLVGVIGVSVEYGTATTTSRLYQVNHSLDDTLPYFDPLLDLRRDSFTPLHSFNITPPPPFDAGFERQTHTPLLPQTAAIQLEAIPGTSSDITHAAISLAETTENTEIPLETEHREELDKTQVSKLLHWI